MACALHTHPASHGRRTAGKGEAQMLATVKSGALMGVDAVVVDVEVDMAMGMPFFAIVG